MSARHRRRPAVSGDAAAATSVRCERLARRHTRGHEGVSVKRTRELLHLIIGELSRVGTGGSGGSGGNGSTRSNGGTETNGGACDRGRRSRPPEPATRAGARAAVPLSVLSPFLRCSVLTRCLRPLRSIGDGRRVRSSYNPTHEDRI